MCTSELDGCTAQSEGFKALRTLLGDLELNHSVENYGISAQAFQQNVGNQYQILLCESPFEEQVFKFLDRKGYEVHCQVGSGSFRIDLVVVECGFPVIAIECDGATYHSSRSARTRDRARQRLLEQKGWVFHRIWSTNWLMCPGDEQTALLVAIESARKTLDTKQGSPF